MAGRPRTPTAELEARNAFKKHPERKASRQNEPKSNGPIGDPPAYFDALHRQVWCEFIDEAPAGVLAKSDRKHLELTVRLECKMRSIPWRTAKLLNFWGKQLVEMGANEQEVEDFKEDFRKMMGCSSQDASLLKACLGSMGMNPAERSKVHGEPEKKESRFAAFANPATSRPN